MQDSRRNRKSEELQIALSTLQETRFVKTNEIIRSGKSTLVSERTPTPCLLFVQSLGKKNRVYVMSCLTILGKPERCRQTGVHLAPYFKMKGKAGRKE
jgi:hypothetical protein